jgi:hypothetical protein
MFRVKTSPRVAKVRIYDGNVTLRRGYLNHLKVSRLFTAKA